MNLPGISLSTKLRIASRGLYGVLKHPTYFGLALIFSVIFFELIFWFNNLPLLQYIVTVPTLSVAAKLHFIAASYTNIWQSLTSPLAVTLLGLSLIQGLVFSIIVYLIKHQVRGNNYLKSIGGSGVASAFAILGLGCAACGSSLVAPVLLFLFSSSSAALADNVGIGIAILGLFAGVYSLYSVGIKACSVNITD